MCPDVFTLDNARGIVKTQSKTLRKIQDTIATFNDSVRLTNEVKKHGVKYSGGPVMLQCSLCEGEVLRRIGTRRIEQYKLVFNQS